MRLSLTNAPGSRPVSFFAHACGLELITGDANPVSSV
jgi:hypothetical protein